MKEPEIIIRKYKQTDSISVLNFLNSNLEFDNLSENILKEKLDGDPNFDVEMTLIAELNNSIVGFIQGVIRDIEDKRYGYIKLFAVKKENRRQKIGSSLYERILELFHKKDVNIVRVYDVPLNYFMPGIDPRYTPALCFFEKLGFEKFDETCNLKVNLKKYNWDVSEQIKKFNKNDIIIRRANIDDTKDLSDFVSEEWKLWKHEISVALKSNPPAVHIAIYKGKIKAFSAYDGNNVGTGWFGPMGTHPDLRGKGIGGILLKLCLQDMKNQGAEFSIIPWVGPISFYSHYAGAVVERVFWRYQKIIK